MTLTNKGFDRISARLRVSSDVLFGDINEEVVLASLTSGKYFCLDEVGSRIWRLLVETGNPEAAVPVLLEEYEVSEEQLRQDLARLVDELLTQGLLEQVHDQRA